HISFRQVDLLERDPALHFPLMFRPIDADVVHARADHEAQHAAAVVESAAVARVHGGVDAGRARHEIERGDDETHAPGALPALGDKAFEIRVRAVHARAVGVIDADAEDEVVLRYANGDVHLDGHRRAGAEGHELAAFVIGQGDAGEHDFAGAPALL